MPAPLTSDERRQRAFLLLAEGPQSSERLHQRMGGSDRGRSKNDLSTWVEQGLLSVAAAAQGNGLEYRLHDRVPPEEYERSRRWESARRLLETKGPQPTRRFHDMSNKGNENKQRTEDDLAAWLAAGMISRTAANGGFRYSLDFAATPTTEEIDMPVVDAVTGQVVELEALAFIAEPATMGNLRPRLALKTSYRDDELNARLKKVMPSGAWDREHRVWHWPLTTASCRRLREACGTSLRIHAPLREWFVAQKALEDAREAERAEALQNRTRVHAEQVKLDAEQALYGSGASAGLMPVGGKLSADGTPVVETVADLVMGAIDWPRIPVAECAPADERWVVGGDGDDWRIPLQRDGAAWLSQNGGGVLVDEVGLGKSRTTLLAATDAQRALVGVHLIVAPLKVARLTWPAEIKKWAPEAGIIPWPLGQSNPAVREIRAKAVEAARQAASRGTRRPLFLVVNHHALQHHPELTEPVWASVIVDEADQVLSVGHRGRGDTRIARGLMALKTHDDGMRVPATGTPFQGKLGNLWGLLDFVRPGAFGPKDAFTQAYTMPAGEHGSGSTLDRVMPGREAAWSHLMGGWLLRRTRLAEQRALIERRIEMVDPLPEQVEQDAAWKRREVWTGEHAETDTHEPKGKVMMRKADGVIVPDAIAAVMRRLQLAVGPMHDLDDAALIEGTKPTYIGPSPKVDWIMAQLGEWGLLEPEWWHLAGETGKVIIASAYTSALDLLQVHLRKHLPPSGWVRIDGQTSMRRLDEAKEAFCAPRGPGILLLSSKAGGAGLTLDQHCQRLVILAAHWTDDVQTQVVGRIENRTWQAPREIITLTTRGTLDAYVATRNAHQAGVSHSLLELAHAG